jgi:hypothetical protein
VANTLNLSRNGAVGSIDWLEIARSSYGRGCGVGRTLGMGLPLGVGVGRGVAVGVGVGDGATQCVSVYVRVTFSTGKLGGQMQKSSVYTPRLLSPWTPDTQWRSAGNWGAVSVPTTTSNR